MWELNQLLNIISSKILSNQAPANEVESSVELTGMGGLFIGLLTIGILILAVVGLMKGLKTLPPDDNADNKNKDKSNNDSDKDDQNKNI